MLVIATLQTGCDVNLFNGNCRNMGVTGYWLCRTDDGRIVYYLEPVGEPESKGGILEGTVQSIGWNDKVIVANRYATFSGDLNGLMVINLTARTIEGPFDSDTIIKRYPNVKQVTASEAWAASSRW